MSHQPERKEKDCLNCGTIVQGHYCHVCGQQNIVPHQSFSGLTKHFIYDIFHFDGKFFDTLKPLFTKPGVVAKQYTQGKRVKFLDPIRMYLFTSAVFFIIFFSLTKPAVNLDGRKFLTNEKRMELVKELKEEQQKGGADSSLDKQISLLLDTVNRKQITLRDIENEEESTLVDLDDDENKTREEYEAAQNALPESKRDSWFKHRLKAKGLDLQERYRGRGDDALHDFLEGFLHRLPYLLFVSLPFFALILKLLYVRRRAFYYSDHAIFTLYHYIFSFLLLLAIFGLDSLQNWTGWDLFGYLIAALIIYWFVYLFKSMRNFYNQGRSKTLGKFLLLNFLGLIVMSLLATFFFVFSIFQI